MLPGGTKIMALAAYGVFRDENKNIYYVDTQDKEIKLFPENKRIPFHHWLCGILQ